MPHSVLEAIQMGIWDYEPETTNDKEYEQTRAMPGTMEKLQIMAERVSLGLPLWHPSDRINYDDDES